jgi:hypothetical protein
MHAPFDRGNRHSEKRGYSLERHLVEEPQSKHKPVVGRELLDRESQIFVSFAFVCERVSERLDLVDQELVHLDSSAPASRLAFSEAQSDGE